MNDYMPIPKAARYMGISMQACYKLIRTLSLKAKKIEGQLFTTEEWIKDYNEHKHCKQTHSIFNGRKVFQPERGELSLKMVSERTGLPCHYILYQIKMGRLTGYRKGNYWIVLEKDIAKLVAYAEEQKKFA